MTVGKCYPGREIVVFSSEWRIFLGEAKNDEILFFPLETKKITFSLKIWQENVKYFQDPFLSIPFRSSLLCLQVPNQLGTPGGETFSERRTNVLNYV